MTRFVSLALLLLLQSSVSPTWAKHPLEPADTSSPRATLASFLRLTDEFAPVYHAYRESPGPATQSALRPALEKVIRLVDMSEIPVATYREVSAELTILLWEVIARLELPSLEDIPSTPADASDDTEDTLADSWRIPHTSIVIARVNIGPRAGEYLFSPDTVANVGTYYDQVKDLPYQRPMPSNNLVLALQQITGWMIPVKWVEALPDWAMTLVLGQVLWKWIAEVLLYTLAVGLVFMVHKITRRQSHDGTFRTYVHHITTPLSMIILAALVHYLMIEQISATGTASTINSYLIEIILYLSIVWLIWITMSNVAEAIIASSQRISDKSLDANLLRLAERMIGILLIVVVLFRFLQNLGVPVYGLVAGDGVGGVAIALAARSTLEDFIGTLNLFADRPARVGDFCRYGEDSGGFNRIGTIEEIGMRSTRIRGLDRTVTTIPNSVLSNTQIVNLTQRNIMLLKMEIGLRLDTTIDQLRVVLARLREMLIAHPRITEDPARVRATGIGKYTIDLEIFAYADTPDWNTFLAIREDVVLRLMEIVEQAGTAFAYPTNTLFLGRDVGTNSDQKQVAEKQVQEWIESQTLPFPDVADAAKKQIKDTLDYPPRGSSAKKDS